MREDGDLRLYTLVDGLPLDGMQEVWGSNPHSSTGKRHNSKTRAASTAVEYRNGNRLRYRTSVWIGHLSQLMLLGGPEDSWLWTEAVKPLSWSNVLLFDPLSLAARSRAAVLARQFQH